MVCLKLFGILFGVYILIAVVIYRLLIILHKNKNDLMPTRQELIDKGIHPTIRKK